MKILVAKRSLQFWQQMRIFFSHLFGFKVGQFKMKHRLQESSKTPLVSLQFFFSSKIPSFKRPICVHSVRTRLRVLHAGPNAPRNYPLESRLLMACSQFRSTARALLSEQFLHSLLATSKQFVAWTQCHSLPVSHWLCLMIKQGRSSNFFQLLPTSSKPRRTMAHSNDSVIYLITSHVIAKMW